MAVMRYEAGILVSGKVSEYLEIAKFKYGDFDYIQTGFLIKTFTIKGDDKAVLRIKNDLDNWVNENESSGGQP